MATLKGGHMPTTTIIRLSNGESSIMIRFFYNDHTIPWNSLVGRWPRTYAEAVMDRSSSGSPLKNYMKTPDEPQLLLHAQYTRSNILPPIHSCYNYTLKIARSLEGGAGGSVITNVGSRQPQLYPESERQQDARQRIPHLSYLYLSHTALLFVNAAATLPRRSDPVQMPPLVPPTRRSRNGCIDCRKAKVKCDEIRSSCGTCARRRLVCQGYKTQPGAAQHARHSPSSLLAAGAGASNTAAAAAKDSVPGSVSSSPDLLSVAVSAGSSSSSSTTPAARRSPPTSNRQTLALDTRTFSLLPPGSVPVADQPYLEVYFNRHPFELLIGHEFVCEMNANIVMMLQQDPVVIADTISAIGYSYDVGSSSAALLPVLNRRAKILANLRNMKPSSHYFEEALFLLLGLCAMEVNWNMNPVDLALDGWMGHYTPLVTLAQPGHHATIPTVLSNVASLISHHVSTGGDVSSVARYYLRALARQDLVVSLIQLRRPRVPSYVWLENEAAKPDRLLGYTVTLMPLLEELCTLAEEVRDQILQPAFPNTLLGGGSATSPTSTEERGSSSPPICVDSWLDAGYSNLALRADSLRLRLESWKPTISDSLSFRSARKFRAQAACYRAGALLYLHRLFCLPGSAADADGEALSKAHDVMLYTSGPPSESKMLLWPVFMAACEMLDADDRAAVLDVFDSIGTHRKTVTVERTRIARVSGGVFADLIPYHPSTGRSAGVWASLQAHPVVRGSGPTRSSPSRFTHCLGFISSEPGDHVAAQALAIFAIMTGYLDKACQERQPQIRSLGHASAKSGYLIGQLVSTIGRFFLKQSASRLVTACGKNEKSLADPWGWSSGIYESDKVELQMDSHHLINLISRWDGGPKYSAELENLHQLPGQFSSFNFPSEFLNELLRHQAEWGSSFNPRPAVDYHGYETTKWINPDIAPLPPNRRTWGMWAFLGFGSISNLCISAWTGAASLLSLGLTIPQTIGLMILARALICLLVIGNGWMGSEWHIGFTVSQRIILGMNGAYIGQLIRIMLSIVWYGSQAWLGGLCVSAMLSSWSYNFLMMENTLPESAHMVTRDLVGFVIFHLISVPFLLIRIEKAKIPVITANLIVFVTMMGITIWACTTGGTGPLFESGAKQPSLLTKEWAWVYGIIASVGVGLEVQFDRGIQPTAQGPIGGPIYDYRSQPNLRLEPPFYTYADIQIVQLISSSTTVRTNYPVIGIPTVGNISAGILNQSDFTRFARKQGIQVPGIIFSLFIPGMIVPIFAILTASASMEIWELEEPMWNPLTVITQWMMDDYSSKARAGAFFCSLGFVLGQIAENILGNGYAAGMDLAGLLPTWITIKRGALLAAALSWAVQPWEFYNTASTFVSVAASFSVFMGPLTGIMMTDYFVVRRQKIEISQLYTGSKEGAYWYTYGFNWRAFVAWVVCFVPAMPGMIAAVNPNVKINDGLYKYYLGNYIFGFLEAGALYALLTFVFKPQRLGCQDDFDLYGTFEDDVAISKGMAPFERPKGVDGPIEGRSVHLQDDRSENKPGPSIAV
ncbi:NCS1 nucleoside transporter [Colletotrichum lupini]|uniref:NCS1 nucleoside transporter n=1 Tax=Colletotrichum lupini TaxID=145971 RepID=A0A9Q8T6G6_9PEZI|nr:NCS1 nucleoside transporter [Colletotrichum lupini]UQC90027.1 NCS1 nucleoside transporter [Colletotrichum lupini]